MLRKLIPEQRRYYSVRLFFLHTKYRLAELIRILKRKQVSLPSVQIPSVQLPKLVNLNLPSVQFPERLRGTIAEKWADYWKNLSLDYLEVFRDTAKTCREKPRRLFLLLSAAGFASALAITNPDETSYRDALIRRCNELALIGPTVRNPDAVEYVNHMEDLYNQETVRYLSLGILSLVWVDDYNRYVSVFRANCTYLQPRYLSMHERVVDIGLFNRWWMMNNRMIDYDVNPLEWQDERKLS